LILLLSTIREINVCNFYGLQTEHPLNTDLFTYLNSNFVYLKRHVKTQMTNLHKEVIKELFETQLAEELNHPEDFARLFMKKEGHTAVRPGEVVHIIQCQTVEVQTQSANLL
jgi:hypothetical protein